MKTMRSRAGKSFLYPKEVYCFRHLTDSSQDLINKPGFLEHCEKWRSRSTQLPDNVLGDCFEGRVWKEFQLVDGEPFLAAPNNFGLMLNVDLVSPYSAWLRLNRCHLYGSNEPSKGRAL